MEPAEPDRPRTVTVIGWTFLVLAGLRTVESSISYVVWRLGGLKEGLPMLRLVMPRSEAHLVDGILRDVGPFFAVRAVAGALVVIVAWNLLRLRSWARAAMEAICWIALLLVGSALFVVLWESAAAGGAGEEAGRASGWGLVIAVCVAVAAGGMFGTVIWFLRRPHVRRAFALASESRPQ